SVEDHPIIGIFHPTRREGNRGGRHEGDYSTEVFITLWSVILSACEEITASSVGAPARARCRGRQPPHSGALPHQDDTSRRRSCPSTKQSPGWMSVCVNENRGWPRRRSLPAARIAPRGPST